MTCGLAVKRPHDYEAYLSPDAGVVETKRPRQAHQPHCSPFRPQLGTLAASLMQSSSSTVFAKDKKDEQQDSLLESGILKSNQLSSTQIDAYLRAEIQYLKRRKLIPHRGNGSLSLAQTLGNSSDAGRGESTNTDFPSSSNAYRSGAISPSSCHSGSDSDSETMMNDPQQKSCSIKAESVAALYEKPQFSLKQVKLICERLLKEQEIRLRYEYESALNKKLEEQHESYVQFAKEQIDTRSNSNDFFYLS
jgi:hypothetical protein